MGDLLVRAVAQDGQFRALAAEASGVVAEACRRHGTWPVASAALGRALVGAALLGAGLKGRETVTLRIHGDGPLGAILAEGDGEGHVRGYVTNPHVDLPLRDGKLDVGAAVGRNGFLFVTRDLGLKEPYTGSSPLVSGEIAEDLTHYLWTSEQQPAAVALGVLVNPDGSIAAAGGYMLQLLPAASDEERDRLESNLRELGAVSRAIAAGLGARDLLDRILAGLPYRVLDAYPLRFRCTCSRERAAAVLSGLGPEEVGDMIRRDGFAELRCAFCGSVYRFNGNELAALAEAGCQDMDGLEPDRRDPGRPLPDPPGPDSTGPGTPGAGG